MKKIVLILALGLFFANNAVAEVPGVTPGVPAVTEDTTGDVDCVQYSAEDAKEATVDSNSNTFSAVFSHAAGRKGSTNKDCKKATEPEPTHHGPIIVH